MKQEMTERDSECLICYNTVQQNTVHGFDLISQLPTDFGQLLVDLIGDPLVSNDVYSNLVCRTCLRKTTCYTFG